MTNAEAAELYGEELVARVTYIRKLFNASEVRIVNKPGRTFLAEGEPKCQHLE